MTTIRSRMSIIRSRMSIIRSRDNPRVKRWAKLTTDASFRRVEKAVVVEGPHLVAEALRAGLEPLALIVSEAGLHREEIRKLVDNRKAVVLAERVFGAVIDAETPPGIAAEIAIPQNRVDATKSSVFLEGLQDPSNVGAILRTAAAFGVGEVVLDRACADPWSPKALRAGQGGHFKLAIRQVPGLAESLQAFDGALLCTVVTEGTDLRKAQLKGRLGWIFGGEGKGVSEAIARQAALRVTIEMAAGTESINVAAAVAICLYQSFNRQ
jgi:TrmH family RNA methyltransferase